MRGWPTEPRQILREAQSIFDEVAPRYDLMRRLISGGREERWKEESIRRVLRRPPATVLDLATGTGDLAALVAREYEPRRVLGLDGHLGMLERAQRKFGPRVLWLQGDLNALPLSELARYDLITVAYGLRYVADLPAFFRGVRARLQPGGVFWAWDLGRPENALWSAAWRAYLAVSGTLLGTFLHGRPGTYWHLLESLAAYPGQRVVADLMRDAGLVDVSVEDRIGGVMAVHVGRCPE